METQYSCLQESHSPVKVIPRNKYAWDNVIIIMIKKSIKYKEGREETIITAAITTYGVPGHWSMYFAYVTTFNVHKNPMNIDTALLCGRAGFEPCSFQLQKSVGFFQPYHTTTCCTKRKS